ncbi:Protein turtle [Lamellibrachia satsuma]|nr:Protein turtle [Lamellibrachia satsuma]
MCGFGADFFTGELSCTQPLHAEMSSHAAHAAQMTLLENLTVFPEADRCDGKQQHHLRDEQSPPVLGEVSPSFLIQKEGDTVDLFCEASATPQPTLTWFKDNKELRSSDTVVIHGNRVQLRGVVRTDAQMAEVEHPAYCSVGCFAAQMAEWLRNDIDVQKVSGLMARAMVYADGSFVVTTVIKEDSGWYKCRPTNGIGSPPEASAYLNVTYLPRVLSMPMQLYLPLGMMGRIECPIEANPAITQVVWTKDGHVVNFATLDRLKLTRQGTLVIETVVAADDGTYTCTPYSPIGAGKSSPPVQVNVRDPPYFSVRPQPVYQRVLGQTVTLPCVAEGDPKPTIVWRKVNSAFPMHTSRNDGNLTINGLAKIDYGVYECIATNKYTSIITSTLVIIESPTIPGRSGASGQTKHSPATSLDHGAREENGLRPLRKTCGHSGLG